MSLPECWAHDAAPSAASWAPERVFREFAPTVYNLALRMLNDADSAEDATLDVLLRLARRLEVFRGEPGLATWLYGVTVDAARGRRRRRFGRPPAGGLEAAIAALPDLDRDVFVLADLEGLPGAFVGDLLGLGRHAVQGRLHRARLALREALLPYLGTACPAAGRVVETELPSPLSQRAGPAE